MCFSMLAALTGHSTVNRLQSAGANRPIGWVFQSAPIGWQRQSANRLWQTFGLAEAIGQSAVADFWYAKGNRLNQLEAC